MTCGMKMYLNWDLSVPYIFFKWWNADTLFKFQVSLVIIFALCFAYEGLIAFRSRYDSYISNDSLFPLDPSTKSGKITVQQNLIRSLLFAASNAFSLFVMMIFMLFNGYICIACIAGAFAGHLAFAVALPEDELSKRPRSCCD